jgi:hypothetical protein
MEPLFRQSRNIFLIGGEEEDHRGAIPRRYGNNTHRILENFIRRSDHARGDRFNQHEQETPDVRLLSTPY